MKRISEIVSKIKGLGIFVLVGSIISLGLGSANAAVFQVSTAAQLHSALVTAQTNGQSDKICLAQGLYIGNFIFCGSSSEFYGVTIEGGYLPDFSSRVVNPANTVLDGTHTGTVLVLGTTQNVRFGVDGITLQNGSASVTALGGGGLSCSTNGGSLTLTNNTISNNFVYMGNGGGVYVSGAATVTLTNNTISNNSVYMGNGGGVCVGATTVTLTNNTISNNSVGEFNSGGGVYVYSATTVTLTNNTISSNSAGYGFGGGVYVSSCPTTVTLSNNIISSNSAGYGGGGVGVEIAGTVTLTNNTISNNNSAIYGGGIFVGAGGPTTVTLTNNTISNNSANGYGGGGGVYVCGDTTVTLTNNTISNNYSASVSGGGGGGVYVYGAATVTLTNNTISNNYSASVSGGGGGVYVYGAATVILTNNTISNNSAYYGGGVYVYGPTTVTLTNNTIYNNNCPDDGGGLWLTLNNDGDTGNIYNNIIWGNSADGEGDDIYINNDGNNNYFYSPVNLFNNDFNQDAEGFYITSSFIIDPSNLNNLDPIFVDAVNGDYHLQGTSPCIDVGNNSAPGLPLTDKDGNPRISNGIVDMGAYEYQGIPTPTTGSLTINSTPSGAKIYLDGNDTGSVTTHTFTNISAGTHTIKLTSSGYYDWSGTATVMAGLTTNVYATLTQISGGTVTVYDTNGNFIGTYTTIQAGIDACPTGGTVTVANGTWTGTGNKNLTWIEKQITVKSVNGPVNCIIDCQNSGRGFYLDTNGTGSTIEGFTIRNGFAAGEGTDGGGGIYCNNSSPNITNCVFIGNTSGNSLFSNGGGIYCNNSSPNITNSAFTENIAINNGGGIYCDNYSSPNITNCVFTGNSVGTGSNNGNGGGICCQSSSSPNITNSVFTGNSAYRSNGGGIFCLYSSLNITNSVFTGNSAPGGGGIYLMASSPNITNSVFTGNSAETGGGITCAYSSSPNITNCVITGNSANAIYGGGGGIYCDNPAPVYKIDYNNVWGNSPDNYLGCPPGTNSISQDPQFVGDYHFQPTSPCIDKGTNIAPAIPSTDKDGNPRIINGIVDMGAYEYQGTPIPPVMVGSVTVYNSNESIIGIYTTIQAGIDNCPNGGTVICADGVYTGFGNKDLSWSGRQITVRSQNGYQTCIIDCENSGKGFYLYKLGTGSTIEGFTTRRGKGRCGGGIYCYSSSPNITNFVFTGNSTMGGDGGIYCEYSSPNITNCVFTGNEGGIYCGVSSPNITNCVFTGNEVTGGGGISCDYSSSNITNCLFTGNSAYSGGGILCRHASLNITNCVFTGNSARNGTYGCGWDSHYGGAIFSGNSSLNITNSVFTGNSAYGGDFNHYCSGGGIFYDDDHGNITNCLFTENSADFGGGIYCDCSSPNITNSVFTGNSGTGSGIYCTNYSSPNITNCIIASNTNYGIYEEDTTSDPPTNHNCFYGNTPADYYDADDAGSKTVVWLNTQWTGNISSNPQFIGVGDYHLGSSSPCIDAGSNTAPCIPATDKDGNPRIVNGRVDIGAYEYQGTGTPTTGSLTITSTPSGAKIYLDGNDTGSVTTHTFTNISAGTHTIKLTLSGYQDWSGTATVSAGLTTYVYATLTSVIVDNNLVGYYKFDSNANDSSVFGNNGVIHGASPASDRFGNPTGALGFDGVGNYISVAHSNSLNIAGDLTIALWICPLMSSLTLTGLDPGMAFVSKRTTNSPEPYTFFMASGGRLRFDAHYTGTGDWRAFQTDMGVVKLNEWQHIAVTRRVVGSDVTLSIYWNGTLVKEATNPWGLATTNNQEMWINNDPYFAAYTNERLFKGSMDDLLIYNRALSVAEIQTLVSNGSLTITSTPSGAKIYLDGNDTGSVTTWTFTNISPGTHTIKLTLSGYQDWSGTATVTAGLTTNVYATLTLTPPTTGSLTITSNPTGAKIYLDGNDTGSVTTQTFTNIPAGTHTIKLTSSGYFDWYGTATVSAGLTTYVYATLTQVGTVTTSGEFPIATTTGREMAVSSAFDGTNYLVGIQGNEINDSAITAQLVNQSGNLVGSRISVGKTSGWLPQVAFDGTNYLMVFNDDVANNRCGQFINKSGSFIGSPFVIDAHNSETDGVAFGGGNYLVIYEREISGILKLYGRIVSPTGIVGSEITISPGYGGDSGWHNVAFDGNNFLVVKYDTNDYKIKGRFVSPAGILGTEFTVNTSTSLSDNPFSAVGFNGTNYLVVWMDEVGGYNSGHWDLFGQIVSPSGQLIGSVTNIATEGQPFFPFVSSNGTNYLVTWTDRFGTTNTSIKGRYFDTLGNSAGSEQTLFAPTVDGRVPLAAPILWDGSKFFAVIDRGTPGPDPGDVGSYTNRDVSGAFITQGTPTPPPAQYGTITGTIKNTSGNPIVGAKMEAFGLSYGSATTDSKGSYTISGLTPGTYTVKASANGYVSQGKSGQVVTAGGTTIVNFALGERTFGAEVHTNHYKYPDGEKYDLELSVWGRGEDIATITVEGPNVLLTKLEYETTLEEGEYRWTTEAKNVPRPAVGGTYTFHVTYTDLQTGTKIGSVTGIIDEFVTIISPVQGSTVATTTPQFRWSSPAINIRSLDIVVFPAGAEMTEGNLIWWAELSTQTTSAIYNFDGTAKEPLQTGKSYQWLLLYRDEPLDNMAAIFSTFTVAGTPKETAWNIQTIASGLGEIGGSGRGGNENIALDSNGYPHIVFEDGTMDNPTRGLKYAKWTGTSWDFKTVESGTAGDGEIAVDSNDCPHIVYYYYSSPTGSQIRYAKWTGTSWDIKTVDSVEQDVYYSFALDKNDLAHISYTKKNGLGHNDLMYAKWTGSTWNITKVDPGNSADMGNHNSIALDSNNYPHIAYRDSREPDALKYAKYTGSGWSIETIVTGTPKYTGEETSIAVDTNNYPHISYREDSTINAIKYAKWIGTNWSIETVDTSNPTGMETSLKLDTSGVPHIVYTALIPGTTSFAIENLELRYAKLDGTSWSVETVDTPGVAGGSLALDKNNYPHIFYSDLINSAVKYATLSPVEKSTTGSLTITSTPSGAKIYLDGSDTGSLTTHTFTNISPGTHTIKLTLSGYQDWSGTATVSAGLTTYVYATLTQVGTVTTSGEFPIATTIGPETAVSSAFDGTNYLVAIEGNEFNDCAITAQLVNQSGNLVGSRISVNSTGRLHFVAFDGTNYLMVWDDFEGTWSTRYGQFVSKSGNLVGSPFVIDPSHSKNEETEGIAFGGGNYLVIHETTVDPKKIYGRIVSPAGMVGNEITISTGLGSDCWCGNIAFDGNNFLVVWCDNTNNYEIKGRFVSPSGSLGTEFTVNASTYFSDNPSALGFNGTNYLVVWMDEVGGYKSGHWDLFGQIVSPSGQLIGSVTNIATEGQPLFPFVSSNGTNYLVTWTDRFGTTNTSIKGRYFDTLGNPAGSEQTLFTPTVDGRVPWVARTLWDGSKFFAVIDRVLPGVIPEVDYDTNQDVYGAFITPSTYTSTTGSLTITSTPSGAKLYLDGNDTTKATPATLGNIPAGTHTIKLTLAGYNDWSGSAAVVTGQTAVIHATLTITPPTSGTISITSSPAGARVYLDGADTTKITPATLGSISAGTHTIKLTLAGYYDWSGSAAVVTGQTAAIHATLTFIPTKGTISITSTPAGAKVYLDGADRAQITPATLGGILAGSHTIKLTLAGYYDWSGSTAVVAGQSTDVHATLTLIPPANLRITDTAPYEIALAWDDMSGVEDGFEILCYTPSQGTVTTRIAARTTGYIHSGTPSSTYQCWVRAYNSYGSSSCSNKAGTTTPPVANITLDPNKDTKSTVGNLTISVPSGAVGFSTDIPIYRRIELPKAQRPPYDPNMRLTDTIYQFGEYPGENLFNKEITLTINAAGTNLRILRGYQRQQGADYQWELLPAAGGTSTLITAVTKGCGIFIVVSYIPPVTQTPANTVNYPNPFSPSKSEKTAIRLTLKEPAPVMITIYDIVGELVKKISMDGKEGPNEVKWDGKNDEGQVVGRGVYFCVIEVSGQREMIKIAVD